MGLNRTVRTGNPDGKQAEGAGRILAPPAKGDVAERLGN